MRRLPNVLSALLSLLLLTPFGLHGQTLTFEGLRHLEFVESYYNGGTGSLGSGPGPDYGVEFSSNALVGAENSPEANWVNTPSYPNALLWLTGTGAIMNATRGFGEQFSFWYASTTFSGHVSIFDGLNGTGLLLATLTLDPLGACGGLDPYCNWANVAVDFAGVARSVDFGGTANEIAFDNLRLGPSGPPPGGVVPEPLSIVLMGTGLVGVMLIRRRRRGDAGSA